MTIFLMPPFPFSNRSKFTLQFSLSQQMKGGDPSPLFKHRWCMCLEYCVQFWSALHKGDRDILGRVYRTATGMMEGQEQFSYEGRLRELELCSLNHLRGITPIHINAHRDGAVRTEPDW